MRECYSNNIEVKTHPLGRLQGVVFTHCSNNNELIKRNDSPGVYSTLRIKVERIMFLFERND